MGISKVDDSTKESKYTHRPVRAPIAVLFKF